MEKLALGRQNRQFIHSFVLIQAARPIKQENLTATCTDRQTEKIHGKTVGKIQRKLLLTAYIKSYTGFRLPPKCLTLNDL